MSFGSLDMIKRKYTCLHIVPKTDIENINASKSIQCNPQSRIGGMVVVTLEQGGGVDSQTESIARPHNLLQFACFHITFDQYEF